MFVLISMQESDSERRYGRDLRNAGVLVPNIHNAWYHIIYYLSIDIVRY